MYSLCELISQAKAGDKNCMMEILTKFIPLIKKYAYKLNYDDAGNDLIESIIQTVYSMPELTNDGKAVMYIKRSMQNVVARYIKAQIERRENETVYDTEFINQLKNDQTDFTDTHLDIKSAVCSLPYKQRVIIVYKFFLGKSDKEVMKQLNISRQSVYINKMKALETLKKLLNDNI